jgi:hypothetical protein
MQKFRESWSASFRSDPVAFYLEITSFIFTVGGSLLLAITALNPDMAIVYPLFLVGAVAGCWGYYRRGLPWPLMLTAYFVIINVFGFGRAILWW